MSQAFAAKKTRPEVNKQLPSLTSGQQSTLDSITGWVQGQIGQGVPAYGGQVAAEASPLQARAFGLAENYGRDEAGLARGSAIADILAGKPAWQQIAADPYYQEYQDAISAPTMRNFNQSIIPQILQSYGAGGPSGAVYDALGSAGADLSTNLAAGRAAWVDNALARAADQRVQGVGLSADESQKQIMMAAGLGETQRAIKGDQLSEMYGKWESSQPWNNPIVSSFLPTVLGTKAFDTYYRPSETYKEPTLLASILKGLSPQGMMPMGGGK